MMSNMSHQTQFTRGDDESKEIGEEFKSEHNSTIAGIINNNVNKEKSSLMENGIELTSHYHHDISQQKGLSREFTFHPDPNNDLQLYTIYDNLSIIYNIYHHDTIEYENIDGKYVGVIHTTNPIIKPLLQLGNAVKDTIMCHNSNNNDPNNNNDDDNSKRFYRIKNCSGVLAPGESTVIISPPGGGSVGLCRALTLCAANVQGDIFYNGWTSTEVENQKDQEQQCDLKKMLQFCDRADVQFDTLTVREILDFSYRMNVKETQMQDNFVNDLIESFDLEENTQTQWAVLSGGQKRRVVVMVSLTNPNCKLLTLKNPTDGLDAAVASKVICYLHNWAHQHQAHVLIAMQQPSPTIFNTFDNVIVLKDGEVLYHGPQAEIQDYFSAMGFHCPSDVELPSFILSCIVNPRLVLQQNMLAEIAMERKKLKQKQRNNHKKQQQNNTNIQNVQEDDENVDIEKLIEELDSEAEALMATNRLLVTIPQHLLLRYNYNQQPGHDPLSLPPGFTLPQPIQTRHGELYPSLCPCIDLHDMKQFWHTSPQYQYIAEMIAYTHSIRQSKGLYRNGMSQQQINMTDYLNLSYSSNNAVTNGNNNNNNNNTTTMNQQNGNNNNNNNSLPLQKLKQTFLNLLSNDPNVGSAVGRDNVMFQHDENTNPDSIDNYNEPHNDDTTPHTSLEEQLQHSPLMTDNHNEDDLVNNTNIPNTENNINQQLNHPQNYPTHEMIQLQHIAQLDALQYHPLHSISQQQQQQQQENIPTNIYPPSPAFIAFQQKQLDKYDQPSFDPLPTVKTKDIYEKGYTVPIMQSLYYLCQRQSRIVFRNKTLLISRLIPVMCQALLFGLMYFQLPLNEYNSRIANFGDVYLELAFNNLINLQLTIQDKQIIHAQLNQYSLLLYTIAVQLCSIPFALFESLVLSSMIYFLVGNTLNVSAFLLWWFSLFVFGFVASAGFRCIASFSKDTSWAYAYTGIITVMLYMCNGFYLRASTIVPFLKFMLYISPFAMALRVMTNIEFLQPRYDQLITNPMTLEQGRMGHIYLTLSEINIGWEWLLYGYLYAMCCIILFTLVISYFLNMPYKEYIIGTQRQKKHKNGVDNDNNNIEIEFVLDQQDYQHFAEQELITDEQTFYEYQNSKLKTNKNQQQLYDLQSIDDTLSTTTTITSMNTNNTNQTHNHIQSQQGQQQHQLKTLAKFASSPITLSWANLNLTVDAIDDVTAQPYRRKLLQNITGYAQPGSLIALQGSSGAGKSTLLSCLLGHYKYNGDNPDINDDNTVVIDDGDNNNCNNQQEQNNNNNNNNNGPQLTGSFFVNGQKVKSQKEYQHLLGYVEQFVTLIPTETVYETLYFAAKMKLQCDNNNQQKEDNSSEDDIIHDVVIEVLEILDILHLKDSLCGDISNPILSPSQLKLVAIGQVLVQNPMCLMADEPTTGLDIASALLVIRALQRVSRNIAVICTIHSPDASIFFMFDALILLATGGYSCYTARLGSRSKQMIEYFQQYPFMERLPQGLNPAEWMIQQVSLNAIPDDDNNNDGHGDDDDNDGDHHIYKLFQTGQWKKHAEALYNEFYSNNLQYKPPTVLTNNKLSQSSSSTTNNNNNMFTNFHDLSSKQQYVQYLHCLWMTSPLCHKMFDFFLQINPTSHQSLLPPNIPNSNIIHNKDDNNNNNTKLLPPPSSTTTTITNSASQLLNKQNTTTASTTITNTNNNNLSISTQFYYVFSRVFHIYTRNSSLILPRLVSMILISIFFSLLFMNLHVNSFNSLIAFLSSTVLAGGNILLSLSTTGLPVWTQLRSTFYREQQQKMYLSFLWPLSFLCCEIFIMLPIFSLLSFILYYFSINASSHPTAFFPYWFGSFLLGTFYVSYGIFLSLFASTPATAEIANNVTATVVLSFSGIGKRYPTLNPVFRFIARFLPLYYINRMMTIAQFGFWGSKKGDVQAIDIFTTTDNINNNTTDIKLIPVRDMAATFLGMNYSQYGWSVLWVCIIIVVVQIGALLSAMFLRWPSRQK